MKRGNDAGLGPPGATVLQEVVIPSASEVLAAARSRSRTPRAAREIKEKCLGWRSCVWWRSLTRAVKSTSVPSRNADWEFPPARLGAPGRKGYRRGLVQFVKQLWRGRCGEGEGRLRGNKCAKSVESQTRLLWWTAEAGEHSIEPHPLTVDKFQLFGALLNCRVSSTCVVHERSQETAHQVGSFVDVGFDLQMRDGKRVCERSIGPPLKCGSFDLQKLASSDHGRFVA